MLQDPGAQLDPFDWYRSQRAAGGVRYDEFRDCYDVFDYETVKRVLADHETFSSNKLTSPDYTEETTTAISRSMLHRDPPEHTELRETVEDLFRPGTVAELAPDVEQMAEDFLDRVVAASDGEFDLVESFAYPLPGRSSRGCSGCPRRTATSSASGRPRPSRRRLWGRTTGPTSARSCTRSSRR